MVGDVVTDTRTLRAGDLFVALRGPRFDGHAFVAEALARGAAGAIVERGTPGLKAGPAYDSVGRVLMADPHGAVVEVGDTTRALQDLAHAVRTAAGTRVVAITGSAGKTTTKETIAAFLATRVPRGEEQGEPEQPHRPAAVAAAAARRGRTWR